jgi:hypothetical protein
MSKRIRIKNIPKTEKVTTDKRHKTLFKVATFMARVGSTVVEHLPHHPKVKGLSPSAVTGTRTEKMTNQLVLALALAIALATAIAIAP